MGHVTVRQPSASAVSLISVPARTKDGLMAASIATPHGKSLMVAQPEKSSASSRRVLSAVQLL